VPYHAGHPFSNDKGPRTLPEMGVPLYCLFNPDSFFFFLSKEIETGFVGNSNKVVFDSPTGQKH